MNKKQRRRRRRSTALWIICIIAAVCLTSYFAINSGISAGSRSAQDSVPSNGPDSSAADKSQEAAASSQETESSDTAHSDRNSDAAEITYPCWLVDENGWRYQTSAGSYAAETWMRIEGTDYYFTAAGYMASGPQTIRDEKYFFSPTGIYQTGWHTDTDGSVYHLSETGSADTGWFTDTDGKTFHFSEDGILQTGWIDDGGHFYLNADGTKATGWLTIDSTVYYLGDDGRMQTGWIDTADGHYYLNSDGVRLSGLQTIDGSVYYLGDDGKMTTGWVTIDSMKYYFDENGTRHTGWLEPGDGNRYYFNQDGMMRVGWISIDGTSCYFTSDGVYDPNAQLTTVPSGPMVALTFDDGPGIYTDRLLDILQKNNAKATFFMIGEQVGSFPSQIQREKALGMQIGNHTWDHKTLTHLDAASIQNEFLSVNNALKGIIGDGASLLRPPGGGYNDLVKANSLGYPLITWSIDTLDWKTKNAQTTYDTILSQVKDGDIILMHEIYSPSVDAAEKVIPELIKRGYQLVTVSEMAQAKGVSLEPGTVYSRIG
ncbi:MAG: polysaccharide deacetylase family protein [Lachnospiraceae bacterium]|jgi:glucan-binding YG repeat protein|nr:polysaccharide deacetylase family protein [Lachnospiraceae bacterium]